MTDKEYDQLPEKIKSILNSFDDNKESYSECEKIRSKLNLVGWDCDYDLSGTIFDVKERKDIQTIASNILEQVKKLDPKNKELLKDIDNVSKRDMLTIEKVLNLPILENSDFRIETGKQFHKENKYPGKVKNISFDGVNGALNKALYENYNFKLNNDELKKIHQQVKEQSKSKGLSI